MTSHSQFEFHDTPGDSRRRSMIGGNSRLRLTLLCALWVAAWPVAAEPMARLAKLTATIEADYPGVRHVTVADYLSQRAAGTAEPLLVDVRTTSEYQRSRLPGAVHAPNAAAIDTLRAEHPGRPLLLYCSVGYRSAVATKALLERDPGAPAANLIGSLFAWANEGLPLENDAGRTHDVHTYNWFWGRYVRAEDERRAYGERPIPTDQ